MKKITLATIAILGAFGTVNIAHAAVICGGGSGGAGTPPAAGGDGNFMVTAIQPKCSANVYLEGEDGANGSFFAVASASAKGKSIFGGHTNGGAIAPLDGADGACAVPGGCTAGEVNGAIAKVVEAATPETTPPETTPPETTPPGPQD